MQNRIFSFDDNAKAAKAAGYGYLNAIHYLAPHTVGGAGNLCADAGGSIAVVSTLPVPETYLAALAIDGDKHDLRHTDPRGCVVWLSPKGANAKRDTTGFVVR